MKSLNKLWQVALEELSARCHCSTSTIRDLKTVTDRSHSEGTSFLTITLPAFGKDFEKSLDLGQVPPELFQGWKKFPTLGQQPGLPKFLSGFMVQVFDRASGKLLDDASTDAIQAIRQLTLMFGKILLPCSDARVEAAFDKYIECEQEVRRSDAALSASDLEAFRVAVLRLYGSVFQQVDEEIYHSRIIPRHGPGATADKLTGNRKYNQTEWTDRLDVLFPFGEYALPNLRHHQDVVPGVTFLEPGAERPVRVITVPKTLKTPRIIAIEPTCMQYVQQGIMAAIVPRLESRFIRTPHGLERNNAFGLTGFTDQEPNQLLAQEGSLTGDLATLDLSEASDRVSNQLVREMLRTFPNLAAGVDACRSRKADVPGHGVIRLAKFASMGSALTFPIEAIVFSTLAVMGIAEALNVPVSVRLLSQLSGRVRVYGDDIIVPADHAERVVAKLESFGFRVNASKSFWNGKFRESCGKEYYAGDDVSIVKVRRMLPTQLAHTEEIVSTVSLRNQFYMLGMWQTAAHLDKMLERVLNGHYPVVGPDSPALGRWSLSFGYETQRSHPHLHSPLVKAYVVRAKKRSSALDGIPALLKCLLKQGDEPFADSEHLLYGGRPETVNIKLRWTRPF